MQRIIDVRNYLSASLSGSRPGEDGGGKNRGEAVIQTYHPDHYSIQAAAVQDYQAFYEEEMSYRMLLDYPPAAYMLAVLGSGPEDEKLVQAMYYLKLYIERIYRENDLHIMARHMHQLEKLRIFTDRLSI